ncbi:MAG: FAD-dependent oxidoreductase [Planctomycetaceae bacterium]|nr:FAD-dependent oxidoreductase [Planctomycetaceae bacterium]
MSQALVIGAGPAGLTGAYELRKLGWNSTILEADDQVGGISRTVEYRGYRFDIGGHRFFSKVPLINELWHEMLDEDFLLRPRMSRIFYDGKFFDYPLKAVNALAGLGMVEAGIIGASYARARLFPQRPEDNFEQWVTNRFGRRLYEIFFKTYTEKVWGIPCREISADWAAQRIKNLSLTEALRNALVGKAGGKDKDGHIITTLIDEFQYPRLGPGMMWEKCEAILNESGNPTQRGILVDKIHHRAGRVESVSARTTNGERAEFGAEQFISSMPLRELIHALDPLPPEDVVRAADGLTYRDFLTVVLIVNREDIFPDNWIYIHSSDILMGRIQNYKNWSPHMVPDASRSSLGLEYFLWDSDDLWTWPDEKLIELGRDECVKLGLIEPHEVEDGTVVRMRKAYPVYDQTYPGNLATVRQYLDTLENFQTVGRNGQHRYNNQDHSMLTAVYAARNIVGDAHDVWAVNVDEAYHEEGEASSVSGDRGVPQAVMDASGRAPTLDEMIAAAFAPLDKTALGAAVAIVMGLGMFVASAVLLVRDGDMVGPHLSLPGHYFLGYDVTWRGAILGTVEAAIGGFFVGFLGATMRNLLIDGYAYYVRRSAVTKRTRQILDEV